MEFVPIIVQPEIIKYIPKEEYEKNINKVAASNFKEYYLTLEALCTRKAGLYPKEVSNLTNRSLNREISNLRRLHEADLIGKNHGMYTVTEENLDDIVKNFGEEVVLLSANLMTDEDRAMSHKIINTEL